MNKRNGKASTVTTVSAATAAIQRNIQIMRITLALTVLSFVTFSITLTSSYWVVINYPTDFFSIRQNLYVVRTTYGIIWECVLSTPTKNSMYGKYWQLVYNYKALNGKTRRISRV
jgi:hypothetical protein